MRYVALFVLLVSRLWGEAAAENADGEWARSVVQLSPFHVRAASGEFRFWGKYQTKNFTVYSDASGGTVEDVALEMERLAAAFEVMFRHHPVALPRIVVVLPIASSDWRRLDASPGKEWLSAGAVCNVKPITMVTISSDWQRDRGPLRASVVRALMARADWAGPFWFTMGVGEVWSKVAVGRGSVVFRPDNNANMDLAHPERWAETLNEQGWLPWREFGYVTNASNEFIEEAKVRRFLAQAAVLCHWLFWSGEGDHLDRVSRCRNQVVHGIAPTDQVLGELGVGRKNGSDPVHTHVNRLSARKVEFEEQSARFAVESVSVTAREMRELFVLAQLLSQRPGDTEAALEVFRVRAPRVPELRVLLAAAYLADGRRLEGYRALLEILPELKGRPEAATVAEAAAELRFARLLPEVTLGSELSAEDAAQLQGWCESALQIEPSLTTANRILAWTWALGPRPPMGELLGKFEMLRTNVGLRAGSAEIAAAEAVARLRAGDREGARQIAVRLRQTSEAPYFVPKLLAALEKQ
ncbi:MAG: hypothetical protein KF715_05195 [Candidatus Didemnitutus sp.]|nr:hypothetical protein [Candidatus Didemnitutus sp.]